MANLETLELTISANAESASQGLRNLINSLSALSTKVGKSVGGLKLLNTQLATLKGNSNIKFSGLDNVAKKITEGGKKVRLAAKQVQLSAEDIYNMGNRNAVNRGDPSAKSDEQWRKDFEAMGEAKKAREAAQRAYYERARLQRELKENVVVKYLDTAPQASQYVQGYINQSLGIGATPKSAKESASVFMEQMKDTPALAERAKSAFTGFRDGVKNFGKEIKSVLPRFTALHRVMRIASTMLVRTGIRTLFKGISEGLGNYYQYSKNIGGEFASVADQLSSSWATLKNQMGAAIAPALSAAIPVINSLASAATTAFNALSQLFALLTGKGSWSKATTQVQAFDAAAKKAGGGGGGMQELLAKFDELNVITSEGGGGGGGGGIADDFTNMFEEMYDFDSKIRDVANFIRETIDWVRKNFDVLLATAGLIGVAILGWKISKAFEGVLSTIGSWITGGALITLGIVLEYDFGKKAGVAMNGGEILNFGDIVEGVAGFIAAGIGGYMIGGGVGAAVGLGLALVATIAGIYVGQIDQKDKNKWGSVELTADEIKKYVASQFSFDVYVEIEILDAKIKNARAAKAHLNGEISEFNRNLYKLKIGVNTEAAITDAKDSAEKVVKAIQDYLTATGSLFDTLFDINPTDVAGQVKKDISDADKQLNEYLQNEGKKVADLYDQGMKNGWKGNEKEQILSLLQHLETIFQAAEADQAYNQFLSKSKLKLKDFTRDTAENILNAQKQAFADYEKALSDATQEAYESLLFRAKLAEEAGLPEVAAGLRRDAQLLVDTFKDTSAQKLAGAKESMKNDWITQLQEVYGVDYSFSNKQAKDFVNDLSRAFKYNEKVAKERIVNFLETVTNVGITKEAKELFGIKGWDLLARNEKLRFFTSVYKAVGVDAVKLLKESINISASELLSISWTGFQIDQQIEFFNAIKNAYGTSNALKAAKDAGVNVGKAIKEGLSSTNADTRKSAEQLVKDIQAELNKLGIKIDASANLDVAINAIIEYEVKENVKKGIASSKTVTAGSTSSSLKPNKTNVAMTKATGAYGIPAGDVFIANEAGAELVGSINGKTSVANQGQIIEGIQRGVAEANSEQNSLLRQQNELLRSILDKDNTVRISASAALGRVARQSLSMYGNIVGG